MGFGRRTMDVSLEEIRHYVTYQVGALQAFSAQRGFSLQHVKPHGALYNMAVRNTEISDTIAGLSRFNNVIEYIRANLSDTITLETLADIAGINPTYFSNLFSKQMGISPIQYLNKRRIEKAQTLLLSTSDTLDNIARQTGFSDTFYFSRMFKKITGISPSLYRKQQIQT